MTADSLLPRNAWGGTVDPVQMATNICEKCHVDTATASSALLYTSKPRGRTRIYYQAYAEELIAKVVSAGISPDASEVHSLLADGYTEDIFLVQVALATHPNDMEAARTMLQAETKE
jgi:hypothetical protein